MRPILHLCHCPSWLRRSSQVARTKDLPLVVDGDPQAENAGSRSRLGLEAWGTPGTGLATATGVSTQREARLGLIGITRWMSRYRSRPDPQTRTSHQQGALWEPTADRTVATGRLRGECKAVYRLRRAKGLQVQTARRAKRASPARVPLPGAIRPDQRWSVVSDRFADGRWFRILL